jgi:hypothetical protein
VELYPQRTGANQQTRIIVARPGQRYKSRNSPAPNQNKAITKDRVKGSIHLIGILINNTSIRLMIMFNWMDKSWVKILFLNAILSGSLFRSKSCINVFLNEGCFETSSNRIWIGRWSIETIGVNLIFHSQYCLSSLSRSFFSYSLILFNPGYNQTHYHQCSYRNHSNP